MPSGSSATSAPGVSGHPSDAPLMEYDEWLRDSPRCDSDIGAISAEAVNSAGPLRGSGSECGGPALCNSGIGSRIRDSRISTGGKVNDANLLFRSIRDAPRVALLSGGIAYPFRSLLRVCIICGTGGTPDGVSKDRRFRRWTYSSDMVESFSSSSTRRRCRIAGRDE